MSAGCHFCSVDTGEYVRLDGVWEPDGLHYDSGGYSQAAGTTIARVSQTIHPRTVEFKLALSAGSGSGTDKFLGYLTRTQYRPRHTDYYPVVVGGAGTVGAGTVGAGIFGYLRGRERPHDRWCCRHAITS